jgi:integrase
MANRRKHGYGTVTKIADGRLWVRGPRQPDGSRPSLGYVTTHEQADALLNGAVRAIATREREGCPTFAAFGLDILDEREEEGKATDQERNRFKNHLATARFARKPLDQITTPDGAEWLREMARKDANDRRGKRKVSKSTVARALSLANVIFDAAGPQNRALIDKNPFLGLEARGAENKTKKSWTFLELAEQEAVRSFMPVPWAHPMTEAERLAILFGAGSGVRQGEQFNLELADLHVGDDEKEPHAAIRFGSEGASTKNDKMYDVPLFGIALDAARDWLKIRKAYLTDNDGNVARTNLVFPSPSGTRRAVGKPLGSGNYRLAERGTHILVSGKPVRVTLGTGTHRYVDRMKEVLAQCGIVRNVRWHDLRHTCGSSLLRGDWGDPWTLPEVKDMLNHSTIMMTERYAHLGPTALKEAAKKVRSIGSRLVDGGGPTPSAKCGIRNDSGEVGPAGLEPATYGLKEPSVVEMLRALTRENAPGNQLVTNPAATLATLLEGAS